MDTKDILIYESGDGGELALIGGDLAMGETLYFQVYLALFGGNVEENTKTRYLLNEERFDYWANTLIWKDSPTRQFNSNTERTLKEVALNSAGRLKVIQAVESDLSYLSNLLNSDVDAQIISVNKIRIIVNFTPKTNQQNKVLQLVYDNAKNEVIIEETI